MFIPTSRQELDKLGWETLDIILITGDSYVDSPFIGISVIGHVLLKEGYRVGIIAQPGVQSEDICRLGEPELFWGVTGGSIDSMVANYTATKKRKKSDDLTPGYQNDRRPDRAAVVITPGESHARDQTSGPEAAQIQKGLACEVERMGQWCQRLCPHCPHLETNGPTEGRRG